MADNEEEQKEAKEELPEISYELKEQINSLIKAKEISPFKELTYLCDELIKYLKLKEKMIASKINFEEERKKFQ